MSARELAQQQAHPHGPLLAGRALEITRRRDELKLANALARMRRAEFLEQVRENRMEELSVWQMDQRKLARATSSITQHLQTVAAQVANAEREPIYEDDWSVLEDVGELETIPYTETVEEQAQVE